MNDDQRGIIMRLGVSDVVEYRDSWLLNVHPSRRHEAIGYSIRAFGLRTDERENWEHYAYQFNYRYEGRALQVGWRCGTLYGQPKGKDGLASAFLDAQSVEWDSLEGWAADFGYNLGEDRNEDRRIAAMYNACTRMGERLERFIPNEIERRAWSDAVADR